MAVPDVTPESSYFGNNSTTTPYVVGFRFDESSWLRVQVTDSTGTVTELAEGTDYTIIGDGALTAASITTATAYPDTTTVLLYRDTPEDQSADFPYTGKISSTVLERALDKLTMMVQDLKASVGGIFSRVLRAPLGESLNQLPSASGRAGKVQTYDADGQPTVTTPTAILDQAGGYVGAGVGLPPGGLPGQGLKKNSSIDYDAEWADTDSSRNLFPPGIYADDTEAYAAGVQFGQIYRKAAGALVWRNYLPIGNVAFLGDSQTAFGAIGLTGFSDNSYLCWLRALSGSKFEITPDTVGGKLVFALGGLKSDQLGAYVSRVITAAPDFVFIMVGTNDAIDGYAATTTRDNVMDLICAPIKAAGIVPIVVAVLPVPALAPGNGSLQLSAKVVQQRDLIQAACAAADVPYYNVNSYIESSPGVADPQYMADDANFHCAPRGCEVIGRELLVRVLSDFTLGFNPLANTDYITNNANFALTTTAGGHTYPTNFLSFAGAPVTSNPQTVFTDAEGTWWRFPLLSPGSGGYIQIYSTFANTEAPAGLDVDGIVRIRVISGTLRIGGYLARDQADVTQASDLNSSEVRKGQITSSDGIMLVRTPIVPMGGGVTRISPALFLVPLGNCTFDISLLTIRKYP